MDDFSSSMEEAGHCHRRPQRGPLVPVAAIAEDHHVPDAPPPPPAAAAAAYTGLSEEESTNDSFKNQDLFDVVASCVKQTADAGQQQPSFSYPAASTPISVLQVLRPRDPNLNFTAVLVGEGSRKRKDEPNGCGAHHLGKENMEKDQPSKDMATCVHCSKVYTAKSTNGTSHLRRHLTSKCLKRKGLTEELAKLTSTKKARKIR
ncbi:Os12g0579900 [Oryza sativa Japonica Group]|uniref:Os12g0579900 protein n=1 Tax=Oryza sativa subsp. japonica TaxID=39947 RepID=A0A0P0YCI3_ORYSJ|nr:Os12g0579900 [Oryza sativa Japonica Group]